MFSTNPPQIGLDITGRAFRVVAISARRKQPTLHGYAEMTVPAGVIKDGVIVDHASAVNLLKQLIDALPGRAGSRAAYVALPEAKTFIKLIEFPPLADADFKNAVEKAIVQHVPFPIDEVYLDWKPIPPSGNAKAVRVLVGAVEKKVADDLVTMLQQAEIIPLGFGIESLATAASVIPHQGVQSAPPTMIIDIGSEQTTAIVFDHGAVQFSAAVNFSDQGMVTAITRSSGLRPRESIKAKQICGLDPKKGKGKVRRILLPLIKKLTEAVTGTVSYYQNGFSYGRAIEQFILVGSGSTLIGLPAYLSEQLLKPVAVGDPVRQLKENTITRRFPFERKAEFATAIGLVISSLNHD